MSTPNVCLSVKTESVMLCGNLRAGTSSPPCHPGVCVLTAKQDTSSQGSELITLAHNYVFKFFDSTGTFRMT